MHMTISNWTATRSGPAITVKGNDNDGRPVKLSGVRQITTLSAAQVAEANGDSSAVWKERGGLFAIDSDGAAHRLLI